MSLLHFETSFLKQNENHTSLGLVLLFYAFHVLIIYFNQYISLYLIFHSYMQTKCIQSNVSRLQVSLDKRMYKAASY